MDIDHSTQQDMFLSEVVNAGLLAPLGGPGLFARSEQFEQIVRGIEILIDRLGAPQNPLKLAFPPIMPLQMDSGVAAFASFPNLVGVVYTFTGDNTRHAQLLSRIDNGEWSHMLEPASLALVSSACHPLYPLLRGVLPEGGRYADVLGHCFRHEPSNDPARLLCFRQRELVFLGAPACVARQYGSWVSTAGELLRGLGLAAAAAAGNDPFFGRAGRLLAEAQSVKNAKTELVVRLYSEDGSDGSAAIASCNLHEDYFCNAFDIRTADGAVAHSACVGFGLERITLALIRVHGVDIDRWPADLRDRLAL